MPRKEDTDEQGHSDGGLEEELEDDEDGKSLFYSTLLDDDFWKIFSFFFQTN